MDQTERDSLKARLVQALVANDDDVLTEVLAHRPDVLVDVVEHGSVSDPESEAVARSFALEQRAQNDMWATFGGALEDAERAVLACGDAATDLSWLLIPMEALRMRWYLASGERHLGIAFVQRQTGSSSGYLRHLAHTVLGLWNLEASGTEHLIASSEVDIDEWLLARGPALMLRNIVEQQRLGEEAVVRFDVFVGRWRSMTPVPDSLGANIWS